MELDVIPEKPHWHTVTAGMIPWMISSAADLTPSPTRPYANGVAPIASRHGSIIASTSGSLNPLRMPCCLG